eukprot:jgi/Undpi1/10522/HiC_scaffold_29.g12972.m1
MLQSPQTKVALRRMSIQAAAERFEDAERAWEATKTRREAEIQGKARERAQNKDAHLQVYIEADMATMAERLEEGESAATTTVHGEGHPMRLA